MQAAAPTGPWWTSGNLLPPNSSLRPSVLCSPPISLRELVLRFVALRGNVILELVDPEAAHLLHLSSTCFGLA